MEVLRFISHLVVTVENSPADKTLRIPFRVESVTAGTSSGDRCILIIPPMSKIGADDCSKASDNLQSRISAHHSNELPPTMPCDVGFERTSSKLSFIGSAGSMGGSTPYFSMVDIVNSGNVYDNKFTLVFVLAGEQPDPCAISSTGLDHRLYAALTANL